MARVINAYKGLAMGVLLIVVMAVICVLVSILVITGQTDFISKAALFLASLLTIKLP